MASEQTRGCIESVALGIQEANQPTKGGEECLSAVGQTALHAGGSRPPSGDKSSADAAETGERRGLVLFCSLASYIYSQTHEFKAGGL
jgi:hypothetical protein